MYGDEENDLVVKYYDLTFGISGESEVNWYLNKVKTFGGPVLDLACGTGRLSILIAKAGYKVTAIDFSEGMLKIFKKSLLKSPIQVRDCIQIDYQSMTNFDLDQKFNTIVCCDAFFHNITVEDEILCLQKVAEHLTPQGVFVFNLPNPSCEYILKASKGNTGDFEERGRYDLGDEHGSLLVEEAHIGNSALQTITTKLRFTRYDNNDIVVEKGESSWISRYLFKYEAIHLLHRCGFEIRKLVGDYKDGPIEKGSQLIFVAGLRN